MAAPNPEAVQDAIRREDLAFLRTTLESSPLAQALGIEFTNLQPSRAAARL